MWELFERRLEKEGLYGAEFRALDIIAGFASRSAATDLEFQRILTSLPSFDFRVLCGRLSDLSEGQSGRDAEGEQGRSPWRRRLGELQRAANAVMTQRKADEYDLTTADLPAIQACESIDTDIKEMLERAVMGGASATDVTALEQAVVKYRFIFLVAALSEGGKRTVGFKIARTLDALGRAAESLGDFTAAETHFDAARQAYAEIGDGRTAAECADKRDAAAQRQLPDADRTLQQLQEALAAMAGPSLARAQALLGLAKLAHGNGDDFEAGHRLAQATEQLSALGFGAPGNGGVDYAFETWIGAIPPGRSAAFNDFLWWIQTVLSLHLDVATLRFLLSDGAKDADADVIRLAEITEKLPGHIKAIQARLQARIASTAGVAVETSPVVPAAATPEPPGQEVVALSGSVNALLSKTANSPDEAKILEQEADALVQRARILGDPYTLALALNAAATIRTNTDVAAALPLFEQAYAQAVGVAGKQAADLAILAASQLAIRQRQLGLVRDVVGRRHGGRHAGLDGAALGHLHALDGARDARLPAAPPGVQLLRALRSGRAPRRRARRAPQGLHGDVWRDITDGHAAAGRLVQADGQRQPAPGLRQHRRRRRAHRRPRGQAQGEPAVGAHGDRHHLRRVRRPVGSRRAAEGRQARPRLAHPGDHHLAVREGRHRRSHAVRLGVDDPPHREALRPDARCRASRRATRRSRR